MARTYLSTQEEVLAVEQKADTANTAINAPDTGLGALNTSVQGLESGAISTNQRVTDLESAVGDEVSGLVKSVTDLDTQLNEADTGIKDRVANLESGGAGGSITVSGYGFADSSESVTVCESDSFRFEITFDSGRLFLKDGITTRVVWFRVGQSDGNGSFSVISGSGAITPLNVTGQQHYKLAVNGGQSGIIDVVYRRFSEASLQCFVAMNLS